MDGSTMAAPKSRRIGARQLPQLIETYTGTLHDIPVSAALAREMLGFNVHNRPLRPLRVANFRSILERGRWVNTGEPVIFSRTALNEGQHRLKAIAETGIEAPLDIRFGIDERAFYVTGTGATRSPGDTLSILGIANGNQISAAVRLLHSYRTQTFGTGAGWRLGTDEIAEYVQGWPDLSAAAQFAQRSLEYGQIQSHAVAFAFLALRQKNEATVAGFLEGVKTGVVPHVGDPARLLREKLRDDWSLRTSTRDVRVRKLALYCLAWQLWLDGKRPKSLEWIAPDAFPYLPGVEL